MYDTRFRKWGISKILKSAEKERMFQDLTHGPSGDSSHCGHTTSGTISHQNHRKLMRWKASRERQERERGSRSALIRGPLRDREISRIDVDVATAQSADGGNQVQPPVERSCNGSRRPSDESCLPSTLSPFDDAASSATWGTPRSPAVSVVEHPQEASSPSLGLVADGPLRTQELVLYNVVSYYRARLDRLVDDPGPADILETGGTAEGRTFWSNINNGIYLWKIAMPATGFEDSQMRGFQALDAASGLARAALLTEPVNFVLEMLTSLSPSNVGMWPALRRHILEYIGEQASTILPVTHPIPMLCKALQHDLSNSFISREALSALLGVFSDKLGRSHLSTFRIMSAIITQMRRSTDMGEVRAAREFAENAVTLAALDHGAESDVTRTAMVELAHVLTKLGAHGNTLGLRIRVVTEIPKRPALLDDPSWRQDGIAAHAMEDIAEYYVRFGCPSEGMVWLKRAMAIGSQIWGEDSMSTLHIVDKIEKLEGGETDGLVVNGMAGSP